MKRQTAMLATFLIAVFAAATTSAVVSTTQHPIALTEKSIASAQRNDPRSTPLYLPTPYLPIPTPAPLPTPEPSPTPIPTPSPTPTPEAHYIPPSPYMLTQ